MFNFFCNQWKKMENIKTKVADTLQYKEIIYYAQNTEDTPVSEIIHKHNIKSQVLDILAKMDDLEESMKKLEDNLNSDSTAETEVEKNNDLLDKTMTALTPFFFMYYMNAQNAQQPIESRPSTNPDEVD